jgi:hypothetical protein
MTSTLSVILNAVQDPRVRPNQAGSGILRSARNDGLRGLGRKFPFLLLALSSLLLAPRSSGGEAADLGQGLSYLRVHALDEAIKPLAVSGSLVLDLRHATATPDAIASFAGALSARTSRSTLFVLVGTDTPAGLTGVLKGNLVTLGIKGSQPEPQVIVEQTAAADRAAYAALESGTPLGQLISGKIEKERFDEATLVHEFKSGHHDAKPPEAGPPAAKADLATPLVDRVLQRAMHLHRALLALKR